MMSDQGFEHKKLTLADRSLAYRQDGAVGTAPDSKPGIMFLSGFFSDMTGTKASYLAERCTETSRCFTRFDYRGHGLSSGAFIDGCIGDWLDDAIKVFDAITKGPQILVGSSMGGWIMLLLALARPERVAGLVGIAAAPDFTEELVWQKLTPAQQQEMLQKGVLYEPSDYGDPLPYTLKLVEEGRKHLLLDKPIPIQAPTHLLQGMKDNDVPWQVAPRIAEKLVAPNVRVTFIKEGDHRLSTPADLQLLWNTIVGLA